MRILFLGRLPHHYPTSCIMKNGGKCKLSKHARKQSWQSQCALLDVSQNPLKWPTPKCAKYFFTIWEKNQRCKKNLLVTCNMWPLGCIALVLCQKSQMPISQICKKFQFMAIKGVPFNCKLIQNGAELKYVHMCGTSPPYNI